LKTILFIDTLIQFIYRGKRVEYLARERAEVESAFSWLSTLGGAFSALGDSFDHCVGLLLEVSMYTNYKLLFKIVGCDGGKNIFGSTHACSTLRRPNYESTLLFVPSTKSCSTRIFEES
jgi:thiamine pyrophosphokinase